MAPVVSGGNKGGTLYYMKGHSCKGVELLMYFMAQEAWPHELRGDRSLSKEESPFENERYAFKSM